MMLCKTIFCIIWITFATIAMPCFGSDTSLRLSPEEQSWIDKHHTVRVRIGHAPPFMVTDGKIRGIAIDYLTHVFERHDMGFEYIKPSDVTWPQALKHIEQHDIVDMVPTAKITEERKKKMIFTDEYIFAPWVIFARSDADFISSIKDLEGKTVSVEEGYVIHEKLKREYPGINLKVASAKLKNFTEKPIKDLSTGLVDAYIGNLLSTTYVIQTKGYTNIKVAAPTPFDNHNQAMAVRDDWPELASIINKTLAAMSPDDHASIRNRWLSIRYEPGTKKVIVFLWVTGVAVFMSLIIGFVLIWNRRLKNEIKSRKKIETTLRESREMFKAVFEQAGGYCMILKPAEDGIPTILDVNKAACETHGYTREELIGKPVTDLDDEEGRRQCLERTKNILSGKPLAVETNHVRKDGSVFPVAVFANVVRFETKPPLILTTEFDISDRRKAETEKQILERKLQQAQRIESIGNLAGGIAHDFNNILSSIIGFTELSLDDAENKTSLEDNLREVLAAGKRARDLVKQILAFARQPRENRKPIRVDNIAKEVLKLIRSTIPATIEVKERIETRSLIMGNASQIHQIFLNLCTNAANAMDHAGGVMEVGLKDIKIDALSKPQVFEPRPGSYIKATVSDTGPGISPEIIESIFDPYFTTKSLSEGTGMGLSIVHGIVESYGGKIHAHSEPGSGAVFSIYLPIIKGREPHGRYENDKLPTGTERILLVDDEPAITKMAGQSLERLGYSVTTITCSMKAIELFRSQSGDFDLVISDMTMPYMTGDRLAVELMKIRPDIPVILCTGYSKKISDGSAAEIGVKAFAHKPIVKTEMAQTVRKVLDDAREAQKAI